MANEPATSGTGAIERQLSDLTGRIEALQKAYTLYFSGELKVPPEKERTGLEQMIRSLSNVELQAPRLALMLQNLTARFSAFNGMWLKRLRDKEAGIGEFVPVRPKAPPSAPREAPPQEAPEGLLLALGDEKSFASLYDHYAGLAANASLTPIPREKMVMVIRKKLEDSKMDRASVTLTLTGGKLNLKVKRAP